jgi:2-succinyl-5-enolpyruvyl-6-hydroxy-3-cyclohexene-1-carboxylate synthase
LQLPAPNKNHFWANLLVEELVRNGVTTFFVAPGSRSTPLAIAAFQHPACHVVVHYDERGTAFMALGYGKSCQRPAVWITTSGTALANGFPAIVEADQEATPMLLLTADRPPELRDTDSNQTIRQDHLFGRSVRWFVDMPAPTDSIDPAYVLTTVDHAVFRSLDGPVHINCMFREPLAPSTEPFRPIQSPRYTSWLSNVRPYTEYGDASTDNKIPISELHNALQHAQRPLFILGRLQGDSLTIQRSVVELCKTYGGIAIADISSQSRLGWDHEMSSYALKSPDFVLAKENEVGFLPDFVVQFGATSLSKRLSQALQSNPPEEYWIVDHRVRRIDPSHSVSHRIQAEPTSLLKDWFEFLKSTVLPLPGKQPKAPSTTGRGHYNPWTKGESGCRSINDVLSTWLSEEVLGQGLTEQAVALMVSEALSQDHILCLGSSNSVRHMDTFALTNGAPVSVLTNRGASGIDGTIASAIGYAIGHQKRPVILLGDLALLYDLNSLALCVAHRAVVVVVNNDGGGIFSHLPIRDHKSFFEPLFGTPHGFGFEGAASMFGLPYEKPTTQGAFKESYQSAIAKDEACLIEVRTQRDANLAEHVRLLEALSFRLRNGSASREG